MVTIDSYALAGLCVMCFGGGCLLQCCIDLYLIRMLENAIKEAKADVAE